MVREKIEDMLLNMGGGIPNLSGFAYTVDAVELAINKPETLNAMTKDLYPAVAEKNGTTSSRVERAIRHLVEKLYLNSDVDDLNRVLGNIAEVQKGKPTNGAFIAALALKAKRNI